MIREAVKGGMTRTICTEVQSIVQTKNGTLRSDMPGARIARIVATKLMPPVKVPMPLTIKPKGPEVGSRTAGKGALSQRGIGKPAHGRSAAGRKAEVHQQAAEQGRPKTKSVQPREGHVPRPDHQRAPGSCPCRSKSACPRRRPSSSRAS